MFRDSRYKKKVVSTHQLTPEQLEHLKTFERVSRYKKQSFSDLIDAIMERSAENMNQFWRSVAEMAELNYDELDGQHRTLYVDYVKGKIEVYEDEDKE